MNFIKPQITSTDLPNIILPYQMGEIITTECLGGVPNTTYKVVTDQKTFAIRIYSLGQSSPEHIQIEHDILKFLSDSNFICTKPILGKDGQILQHWGNYPLLATEFIEGTMADASPLTPILAFNTGRLLNSFRQAMASYTCDYIPTEEHFLNKANDIVGSLAIDLYHRGWKMDVSRVPTQWQQSSAQITKALPHLQSEIIHCDFWPPNLKCVGDTIVGLMDFDDWVYAPAFFDLVVAFVECTMIGGPKINRELATNLLKGYFQSGGSLSPREIQLFPDAIEAICCLFLAYNIAEADDYESADVYLRRLSVFQTESSTSKFRHTITNLLQNRFTSSINNR